MVFSSPRFFAFLLVLLIVLGLVSGRDLKKRLLAVASCFFYAAWDWRYLGLLLLVSVIDYVAAWRIHSHESERLRKAWLVVSMGSNLAILAYFKYCNFFIENANHLLGAFGIYLPHLDILLPVGISFYTFKTMSYTVDVYRRQLQPCRSWLDYATFITFFPELIAGPIVRASVFLPQMDRQIGPTTNRIAEGSSLFLLGLFKKLFIADRMAVIADTIFEAPGVYASGTVWCGVIAYAIQIYCDFSGYSDMAIGTAKMIGYDLPENFNMPYTATSITEFWRRWHMTLSNWLRDYLYIPLGGNRHGRLMTYRNLIFTMLLGGLWHGASWNFVLWGGLHGGALAVHKLWKEQAGGRELVPDWLGRLLTLAFVVIAWVPFRSHSWDCTTAIFSKLIFLGEGRGVFWLPIWLAICALLVFFGHLVGLQMERLAGGQRTVGWVKASLAALGPRLAKHPVSGPFLAFSHPTVAGAYVVAVALLALFLFAPLKTNPFIYFQF